MNKKTIVIFFLIILSVSLVSGVMVSNAGTRIQNNDCNSKGDYPSNGQGEHQRSRNMKCDCDNTESQEGVQTGFRKGSRDRVKAIETTGTSSDIVIKKADDLSADELYWLTYMREEEKLARDVYLQLYDLWGLKIFKNIAESEQRHMDAVKTLLDGYEVADPAEGKILGEFTDVELGKLYLELVELGDASLVEALNVGVLIEKTDIADLEEGIAATTHSDISKVYSNLFQGSLNHLDAFESVLAKYS